LTYSSEDGLTKDVIGGIFFTAGFIPLYGLILEIIEQKNFEVVKSPTNGLALFLLIMSFFIQPNPEDGYLGLIGNPLLEAGLLYLTYRLLFLEESDSALKDKLKKENEMLKRSAANGLADGYFHNFVKKVANTLKEFELHDEKPGAQFIRNPKEKTFEKAIVRNNKLFLIVPLNLNVERGEEADDIRDFMNLNTSKGQLFEGKVDQRELGARQAIVKFMTQYTDNGT